MLLSVTTMKIAGFKGGSLASSLLKQSDSSLRAKVLAADKDDAAAGKRAAKAKLSEILVRSNQDAPFLRSTLQYFLIRRAGLNLGGIGDVVSRASQEGDSLRLDVLVGVELQRLSPGSGM